MQPAYLWACNIILFTPVHTLCCRGGNSFDSEKNLEKFKDYSFFPAHLILNSWVDSWLILTEQVYSLRLTLTTRQPSSDQISKVGFKFKFHSQIMSKKLWVTIKSESIQSLLTEWWLIWVCNLLVSVLSVWSPPAPRQQIHFQINSMAKRNTQNYLFVFILANGRIKKERVHVHRPKRLFKCMYNKFRCSSHFMVRKISTAQSSLNLHFPLSILMQSLTMDQH